MSVSVRVGMYACVDFYSNGPTLNKLINEWKTNVNSFTSHILNEQRPIYSLYSISCFVFDIDTHLCFILSVLTLNTFYPHILIIIQASMYSTSVFTGGCAR